MQFCTTLRYLTTSPTQTYSSENIQVAFCSTTSVPTQNANTSLYSMKNLSRIIFLYHTKCLQPNHALRPPDAVLPWIAKRICYWQFSLRPSTADSNGYRAESILQNSRTQCCHLCGTLVRRKSAQCRTFTVRWRFDWSVNLPNLSSLFGTLRQAQRPKDKPIEPQQQVKSGGIGQRIWEITSLRGKSGVLRQRICGITLPRREMRSASATKMCDNVTQEGNAEGFGKEYEG